MRCPSRGYGALSPGRISRSSACVADLRLDALTRQRADRAELLSLRLRNLPGARSPGGRSHLAPVSPPPGSPDPGVGTRFFGVTVRRITAIAMSTSRVSLASQRALTARPPRWQTLDRIWSRSLSARRKCLSNGAHPLAPPRPGAGLAPSRRRVRARTEGVKGAKQWDLLLEARG